MKILLHFALVLHFAAILITFCVNITFWGDYYISRRNTPSSNTDAATKKYVDDNSSGSPTTSQLTVNSNIDMKDRYRIQNLKSPLDADGPATKQYADSHFLDRDGSHGNGNGNGW